MIRKLFTLFFSLLPFLNKAQCITAGQALPGYIDINPDKLISLTNYSLDINGDSQNDLKFVFVYSPGAGTQVDYHNIEPLNSNTYLLFGRIDSIWHNFNSYWWVSDVSKPLASNDTINKTNAVWSNSILTLRDKTCSLGTCKNILDWVSSSDRYIGVKYQTSTDTLIGWIRINMSSGGYCYIKDYSFSCSSSSVIAASSASVICAGESATLTASGAHLYNWSDGSNGSSVIVSPTVTTNYTVNGSTGITGCLPTSAAITLSVNACVGINEYEMLQGINLYPNPASDRICLENPLSVDIKKFSLLCADGKEIPLQQNRNEIMVSALPEGIYFLKLDSNQGVLMRKVVVRH